MTIEFQGNLLKYLFQNREATKYEKHLDESIFDDPFVSAVVFKLWKSYIKVYRAIPSKPNFIEYFEQEWESSNTGGATPDMKKGILNTIAEAYSPLGSDVEFIQDTIIGYAQRKLTRRLFVKNADKVETGGDKFFKGCLEQMAKIVRLKEDDTKKELNRGHYYIKEPDVVLASRKTATPTRFYALNRLTSAGGFYAPQLVVFMKGPKAYGTGLLLDMVAFSLKQGRKVFYADTENGLIDIYTRLDMALLHCEYKDLKKHRVALKRIKAGIALRGGEFKAHFFGASISTMDDLDSELTLLEAEGFKPDELYNDYLDKFVPTDRSIKDERLKLNRVYEDQMNLNSRRGLTCFTISPITGDANKPYYTHQDVKGDKGKGYNCHALFAICCTDNELKSGTMRIIPVLQRQGVQFMYNADTTCSLKVNRATAEIEEIDSETYLAVINLDEPTDSKKGSKAIDLKGLKDE